MGLPLAPTPVNLGGRAVATVAADTTALNRSRLRSSGSPPAIWLLFANDGLLAVRLDPLKIGEPLHPSR